MASAASSAASAGAENCPDEAARGSDHLPPRPKVRAASLSDCDVRRFERPAKAVLHDRAKSVTKGTGPGASPSKLVNGLPPTTARGGQGTIVSTVVPACSRAVAVTTLNDEPGG